MSSSSVTSVSPLSNRDEVDTSELPVPSGLRSYPSVFLWKGVYRPLVLPRHTESQECRTTNVQQSVTHTSSPEVRMLKVISSAFDVTKSTGWNL